MPPAPCSKGSMISAAMVCAAVGEQRLEGRQRAGFALFRRIVAVEGRGAGEHHDFAHQVAERAEQLRAAPERHGAERVAVIAAVEGDQRPPPRSRRRLIQY